MSKYDGLSIRQKDRHTHWHIENEINCMKFNVAMAMYSEYIKYMYMNYIECKITEEQNNQQQKLIYLQIL